MPFTVAHEKLLTAYAGETLPDLCQLGNTWIPEFAALDVLEPLDGYVANSKVIALDDYFEGILASNRLDKTLFGIPWYVDTRLLYYRRDLLRQAGFNEPPQTWQQWSDMLGAIKNMVGPERYSVLLPLNEFEPLLVLALQLPAELLREGGRWGNFRSDDFRRALTFYESMFERSWAPRMTNTQISNVWDEFGRGFFSFYISGPVEHCRVQTPSAALGENEWMTATMPGPEGPGLSSAGGSSLVIFKTSQAKPEAWLLAEYLSRPAVQQRFYDLTGDMPPRRSSWQMPALVESPYARAFLAQLDRVRSPPKVPEWERIATEMRLDRRASRAGRAERSMKRWWRSIARPMKSWPSVAGCWNRTRCRVAYMKRSMAAWWFVGPALIVLGVFFFVPVIGALPMSMTDFDLYALSDWRNLRFIGFHNYVTLLQDPLFWKSLGNTLYFVALGVPLSIGSVAGRGAAGELQAGQISRLLSHRVLRAGRYDAGRCRRRVALHLSYALRVLELRTQWPWASTPSIGWAIRTGPCRPSSSSRCGRTSATT